MVNAGLNSQSINYEVALEVLGQSRQPILLALQEERAKAQPSQLVVNYCLARLSAIDDVQDDLRPEDLSAVARILDKGDKLFRTN